MTRPAPALRTSLGLVTPALAVAGALGYAVFVGAGRLLGPADFALFAAFWGLLFGLGAMTAPIEQETARLLASGKAPSARRLLVAALTIALLLIGLVLLWFPVTVGRVLSGSWLLAGLAAVAVIGFAVQQVVRGAFLGTGRITGYAAMLGAEAGVRAVGLVTAVLVLARVDLVICASVVTLGSFAWVGAVAVRPLPSGRYGAGPRLKVLVRNLGGLVLAAGFTAAVVTGFPALAAAFAPPGIERQLGIYLAALTVTRLPLLLLGPIQAVLVPELVRRGAAGTALVVRVVQLAVAVSVLAALLALLVGPALIRLIYGGEYVISAAPLAGMTLGAGLVAVQLLLAAALLAAERHRAVVACWAACAGLVLLVLALPVDPFTTRIVTALLAGPFVGVAVALVSLMGAGSLAAETAPPAASGRKP